MRGTKKLENNIIAFFILFAIGAYSLTWLQEKIGTDGIIFSVFSIIVAIALASHWKKKKYRNSFDALALYTLRNTIPQDKFSLLTKALAKKNFREYELIVNLKTIRESVHIALSSKNRETAESRMETALERFDIIQNHSKRLISSSVFDEIKKTVDEATEEFKTKLYINIALGHINKASGLKTNKSKSKYLGLAKSVLEEGLQTGDSDYTAIKNLLAKVDNEIEMLSE